MLQYFMTFCTEQWTVLKLQCVNVLKCIDNGGVVCGT